MENSANPLRLTRSELYDRVWESPVIRVAEQFGITNFLLTGICRKHEIPTPPAGYWSKVAHDKAPARSPLGGDAETLLDIGRVKTPGYRASMPVARGKGSNDPSEGAEPLKLSEPPSAIHAKAVKTIARLRAGKGEGLIRVSGTGCFKVTATAGIADRVEVIFDRLVTKVEEQGWRVKGGDARLELDIDGEVIGFEVVELTDRVVHRLTEAEHVAKARYEARVAQAQRTGAYVSTWDAPRIADWDHVPNGKLSLVLDENARYRGVRRTFSDRKTQRVETRIDCIAEALSGYAAETKRRRIEAENARIRSEEEGRRREALRKLQEIETRRVEFADRQIVRLEKLSRMTALIAHLGEGDLPSDTDRFRDWLKRYVGVLQADLGADRIETRLMTTRLMHDDATTSSWIDVETGGYRSSV